MTIRAPFAVALVAVALPATAANVPLCSGLTVVTAINSAKGDYESIKTIESVSNELGARIAKLDARIDSVRNELGAQIETLAAKVETLGGKFEKLAGTVDMLKWMLGFIATLNIAIFVKLILNH